MKKVEIHIIKKKINLKKELKNLIQFMNELIPDFITPGLERKVKKAIKDGLILDEDGLRIFLLEEFVDYVKESI
ncbi:MAG: hypothetical protein QXI58_00945 [Candidatus Micrarchaeia archaeon]